ncbi:hypothetical protein [Sporolactobacillus kofuensis]|nr:hypothetical protein [Sporolactobacillus kofuensis]
MTISAIRSEVVNAWFVAVRLFAAGVIGFSKRKRIRNHEIGDLR